MIAERKLKMARLTGFATADGFWRVRTDRATIGKTYTVDVNTRRTQKFFNLPAQKEFECEIVDALDDQLGTWDCYPTELLEIEK